MAVVTETSAAFDFNPLDPATRDDPFPWYARGRADHPVHRHPALPIVSMFRYDDVLAILRDAAGWSSDIPLPPGIELPPDFAPSMLITDPPEHGRLRGLVNQAFTPRMVARLEDRIRAVADELLDDALERGRVDLIESFTHPLPVIVIAEMIGVPVGDREDFKRWSDELVEDLGTGILAFSPDQLDRQARIRGEMARYFEPLIAARRADPREDLLSGLVAAELEGSRLSFNEMISMLVLLLVAGNETTTNLIGNAALALLREGGQLARLRADRGLLASAVDEVLRWDSPVQATVRRATRRAEIRGHTVAEGELALVWIGSANRDEEIFPDPDRFDVARDPNRHIAFGFGTHYCLGANLARLEARIALDALLGRTRSFERVAGEPVARTESFILRGVRKLPVELLPA
ncbi:MAG TPA: cytochrome P450 [Candidatus Binatia bacterium]|nr:cytochrome P450 [Candidatus Binatia bacterium]